MKIVILNGSPRKGNTRDLLKAFMDGAKDAEIDYYNLHETKVAPCEACNSCTESKGKCKHNDATNEILSNIHNANAIVFGSPVYWWGVTAQLKAMIDKMYAFNYQNYQLPHKRVGLIMVGGMETNAVQYQLISSQFKCICEFLNWDFRFNEAFCADVVGAIKKDKVATEKAKGLFEKLL